MHAFAESDESSEEVERIVGGKEVDIRQFPHQVSLRFRNRHICGATIISAKHCLTAAHCYIKKTHETLYTVLAGSTANSGANARQGSVTRVARFILHERYVEEPPVNDIAVLILATQLPINGNTIRVAVLPAANEKLPFGKIGAVSGWYVTRNIYAGFHRLT